MRLRYKHKYAYFILRNKSYFVCIDLFLFNNNWSSHRGNGLETETLPSVFVNTAVQR